MDRTLEQIIADAQMVILALHSSNATHLRIAQEQRARAEDAEARLITVRCDYVTSLSTANNLIEELLTRAEHAEAERDAAVSCADLYEKRFQQTQTDFRDALDQIARAESDVRSERTISSAWQARAEQAEAEFDHMNTALGHAIVAKAEAEAERDTLAGNVTRQAGYMLLADDAKRTAEAERDHLRALLFQAKPVHHAAECPHCAWDEAPPDTCPTLQFVASIDAALGNS